LELVAPAPTRAATGARWAFLLALSGAFILVLEALRLPAALLLGPMAAAICVASANRAVRVPLPPFVVAQGVIGCMIARSITPAILGEILRGWPIFLATVVAVIAASGLLGWLLTRWRVLPGTTAIWGSSPGAATAMMLMAEAYGADIRLVAFMQYLRVVFVAIVASMVARIWTTPSAAAIVEFVWLPPVAWLSFAETLLLAGLGAAIARRLRVPAGPLLIPLAIAVILQDTGAMTIELPPLLLSACYALVGWSVGLCFTRPILRHALRALPQVVASTLALIAICAGLAAILVVTAGVDPLTAYLATSPGGADGVAIIAAASNVDLPFVMAMQTARLFAVILLGPHLARFIAKRSGVSEAP
jgi:membrane AbrB-like protein